MVDNISLTANNVVTMCEVCDDLLLLLDSRKSLSSHYKSRCLDAGKVDMYVKYGASQLVTRSTRHSYFSVTS